MDLLTELRSIERKLALVQEHLDRLKYYEAQTVIETTRRHVDLLLRTASPTDDSAGKQEP